MNRHASNDRKNSALRFAGIVAVATAGYHAVKGNRLISDLPLGDTDMSFVSGTYQLGTMGWIAGGALLIGAARLTDRPARNLIVTVCAVLFGVPAFGTLALTGGELSVGGVALATVVALALYGRRLSDENNEKIAVDRENVYA